MKHGISINYTHLTKVILRKKIALCEQKKKQADQEINALKKYQTHMLSMSEEALRQIYLISQNKFKNN